MNPLSPLPTDDVDGVLRAFFRAEAPAPWPKAPQVAASTAKGWPLTRSRLALAAAAALLALGLTAVAALPGRRPAPEAGLRVENPSASAANDPLHHSVQPRLRGSP